MAYKRPVLFVLISLLMIFSFGSCEKDNAEQTENMPEIKTDVNVVVNPSFEEWEGFMPVGWELRQFSGDGDKMVMFGKSSTHYKSGRHSYYIRGIFNTDKWMVLCQRFPIKPGYDVFFSAEMKTDDVEKAKGQDADCNIYIIFYDKNGNRVNSRHSTDASTMRRIGTSKWAKNKNMMNVPDKARSIEIGLINRMSGYAYFDDIELVFQPEQHWEKKETRFVDFKWLSEKEFPQGDIDRFVKLADEITKDFGIKKLDKKVEYYFYPSEDRFLKLLRRKRYKQLPRWGIKEFHSIESYEDHDMIHMILYDLGTPPMGLAKGVVFHYREKIYGWDLHNCAKQDLINKRLPVLYKTISKKEFIHTDVSVTVPSWGSFVNYMIEKYGMDKIVRLFKETDGVDSFGDFNIHFKEIYGEEFPVIDQQWRMFLLRYECDAAADTLI
ncbi:MAG: hypothetical protein JW746_00965 [Candidatus Krumholzibacteriota bacterium]|nr:hypothetical protein [Candidatus Krumholzibacteriota bacterium]